MYSANADGIMSVQILNGMHIYTPWNIFSRTTFKLVYNNVYGILAFDYSRQAQCYVRYMLYICRHVEDIHVCIKLSTVDTKMLLMKLHSVYYTEFASNLRLFYWNFFLLPTMRNFYVIFMQMMIAYDFLQWKWNFLGCSKRYSFQKHWM